MGKLFQCGGALYLTKTFVGSFILFCWMRVGSVKALHLLGLEIFDLRRRDSKISFRGGCCGII